MFAPVPKHGKQCFGMFFKNCATSKHQCVLLIWGDFFHALMNEFCDHFFVRSDHPVLRAGDLDTDVGSYSGGYIQPDVFHGKGISYCKIVQSVGCSFDWILA
jgi:hypothetical protein